MMQHVDRNNNNDLLRSPQYMHESVVAVTALPAMTAVTTVLTGVAVACPPKQARRSHDVVSDKLRKHVKARHEGLGCPVPLVLLTTPIDCALSSSRSSGSCPTTPLPRPSRPPSLPGNSLGCRGRPEHLQPNVTCHKAHITKTLLCSLPK